MIVIQERKIDVEGRIVRYRVQNRRIESQRVLTMYSQERAPEKDIQSQVDNVIFVKHSSLVQELCDFSIVVENFFI